MEQYGIMDCLDHPTDFCFALAATALVSNTEADLEAAVLYQRGAHPRNNHPGLPKPPIFPSASPYPPEGWSFPPAVPAAARRGRPGPAAADGGWGAVRGGRAACFPSRHPARAARPPPCLPPLPAGTLGAGPAEPELDPRSSSSRRGQVGVRPHRVLAAPPSWPRPRPPRGAAITRGGGRRHPGLAVWGWALLWDGTSLSLVFSARFDKLGAFWGNWTRFVGSEWPCFIISAEEAAFTAGGRCSQGRARGRVNGFMLGACEEAPSYSLILFFF